MAADASSTPKKTKKAQAQPKAKPRKSVAKAPKLSARVLFWRRALRWMALGLRIVGVGIAVGALIAYLAGLFVSNSLTALTLEVEHIWYLSHSFSLDLFQVFIERKLFFWLPNPTDPWFNVVRPVLFQTPLTLAAVGGVLFAFGWGIGRIVRVP